MTSDPQGALPRERRAGVCLHLTSLPGQHGIGDIGTAARRFVDTLADIGLSVWQILPLGPTGFGDSPYQSLSTFAGNELLVDIGDLVDLGLLEASEVTELASLPLDYVDYEAVIRLKMPLLDVAAKRFAERADHNLRRGFEAFVEGPDKAWLEDYARFRVLKSLHDGQPWSDWPPEYAGRDAEALAALGRREATRLASIKVQQFLFRRQWRRLREHARRRGVLLFGDLPIYIALDSADAWARRDHLQLDKDGRPTRVAGVPPDYFSEDGQLWGNPLYDWERHAADGYAWWIERIRATAALCDLVRIDHFRGFEAYWSVPADASTARDGHWEPGPGGALFDALRAALGNLPVVAEDLGVITPEVEHLRDHFDLPGMRVLQFDVCAPGFSLDDVGENSVCYTGTHDNDTTVGWFAGSPGDARGDDEIRATQETVLALTGGSAESVAGDFIQAAFSTAARLAIAPMQDFLGLGSAARFNTPGTAAGNWRWRVTDAQLSREVCDNVAELVRASGRELEQYEHDT